MICVYVCVLCVSFFVYISVCACMHAGVCMHQVFTMYASVYTCVYICVVHVRVHVYTVYVYMYA